MNDFLIVFVF